jgi:hypothetical protein
MMGIVVAGRDRRFGSEGIREWEWEWVDWSVGLRQHRTAGRFCLIPPLLCLII